MGVCVEVDLVTGRYEAQQASGEPEWPPHPYRMWAALVAAAGSERTPAQTAALEALAGLGPPVVWAAALPEGAGIDPTWTVYVPSLKEDKLAQGVARWADRAVWPPVPKVRFDWRENLGEQHLNVLQDLAGRVGYLGRAGCFVTAAVRHLDSPELPPAGLVGWEPCAGVEATSFLRVPTPGLLADLDQAVGLGLFAEQRRPAPRVGYRRIGDAALPVSGPWERIVCWRLTQGEIPPQYVLPACEMLREAVLAVMGDGCPPVISGHAADGAEPLTSHVAWMALVNVGHRYADGRIMGFAAALPQGAPAPPTPPFLHLRRRKFRLAGVDESRNPPWTLTGRRWSGPATVWVSATPVSLPWVGDRDGFRPAAGRAVRTACRKAGFPTPVEVAVQEEPFLIGALPAHRYTRSRKTGSRRRACHAMIRFPVPVIGPVAVGPFRHFGLGVFVPAQERG